MSVSAGKLAKSLSIVVSFVLGCAFAWAASASARSASGSSKTAHSTAQTSKKKHRRRHYSRRQPFQKAPTRDRISEIQSALARNGYYHNDPNGKWDSSTISAMQKFQADHGLDSNGKIDALTLQKLGLGSDIAGVSAPRPLLPASSPASPATPPSSKQQPSKDSASASSGTQSASTASPASSGSNANSKPQPPQQ